MFKENLGRKRFIWLMLSRAQSITEGTVVGSQGSSWSRHHRGTLLTGLCTGSCSANFLTQPRPTCPGMMQQTRGWALSQQSQSRQLITDVMSSLIQAPSSQVVCGSVRLLIKANRHMHLPKSTKWSYQPTLIWGITWRKKQKQKWCFQYFNMIVKFVLMKEIREQK